MIGFDRLRNIAIFRGNDGKQVLDSLDDYLQGGVIIDAVVSTPILESIFNPGSQLHDGAVFIRDSRIIKAGCLLPSAPMPS
jgi:DNA integrity scanning protein DisA with diadenylate cyclase activity